MARLLSRSLMWILALMTVPGAALALPDTTGPVPGGIGLQPPVTAIMRRIEGFHNGILLWTCILIVALVLGLLLWIMVRYNAKANPNPGTFTPQHVAGGRLDGDPGRHPRHHRDPLVQPPRL